MINMVYRLLIEYAVLVTIATQKYTLTDRTEKRDSKIMNKQSGLRSQLDVK